MIYSVFFFFCRPFIHIHAKLHYVLRAYVFLPFGPTGRNLQSAAFSRHVYVALHRLCPITFPVRSETPKIVFDLADESIILCTRALGTKTNRVYFRVVRSTFGTRNYHNTYIIRVAINRGRVSEAPLRVPFVHATAADKHLSRLKQRIPIHNIL